jgi:hypothetical protein
MPQSASRVQPQLSVSVYVPHSSPASLHSVASSKGAQQVESGSEHTSVEKPQQVPPQVTPDGQTHAWAEQSNPVLQHPPPHCPQLKNPPQPSSTIPHSYVPHAAARSSFAQQVPCCWWQTSVEDPQHWPRQITADRQMHWF